MPIYDYVCGSCGHRFEVFRGINEAGPHQCPECGGPVARAFAPPTIHFKGTGWAKSDRRASSARSRRAETATPASDSQPPASTGQSEKPKADSSGSSDSSHDSKAATAPAPATEGKSTEKPALPKADR